MIGYNLPQLNDSAFWFNIMFVTLSMGWPNNVSPDTDQSSGPTISLVCISGDIMACDSEQSTCSVPVNSFKQGSWRPSEGSPRPHANFFCYIELNTYMSSVGSGSILCRVIDPRSVSYLKHSTCEVPIIFFQKI